MKPGKFIVVEGSEGAGKSTAIKIIENYLKPLLPALVVTREPGGTRIGEAVRTVVKENTDELMDKKAELLLMYAARVQLVSQVIQPALQKGDWVLSDRFELSTYAYQGGGRGISFDLIQRLSELCLQGFKPDLTLFMDIKPELGLERMRKRGEPDRIEQEPLTFFNQVYQAYHQAIRTMTNVVIIDASQPLEAVKQSIITHIDAFINEHTN